MIYKAYLKLSMEYLMDHQIRVNTNLTTGYLKEMAKLSTSDHGITALRLLPSPVDVQVSTLGYVW